MGFARRPPSRRRPPSHSLIRYREAYYPCKLKLGELTEPTRAKALARKRDTSAQSRKEEIILWNFRVSAGPHTEAYKECKFFHIFLTGF